MKGELGSGKTTLVQMVAQILKLKTSITSPTFNILKLYSIPTTSQKKYKAKQLCHIDLYRLHSVDKTIGFSEYLGNEDFICFVEWSEKITKQLPKNTVILSISVNGTQRTIKKQD
jgi:tRNA threonylcarbamoyladenosine biosynthesis protein TsaE